MNTFDKPTMTGPVVHLGTLGGNKRKFDDVQKDDKIGHDTPDKSQAKGEGNLPTTTECSPDVVHQTKKKSPSNEGETDVDNGEPVIREEKC